MTLVDWQIQWHCGDRSFEPQWWNLKALAHKWLLPCPEHPMIYPYNPEQVNAASYDVCIGNHAKIIRASSLSYRSVRKSIINEYGDKVGFEKILLPYYGEDLEFQDINLCSNAKVWLFQNDFLLTETIELFHIPRNISAQFALKSSRGREGYEHLSAGFIDPAWHGSKLTMELFNANPNPIPIYKGLKIGQIIFTRTDAQPIKAYDQRGRYNNDDGVRESKG